MSLHLSRAFQFFRTVGRGVVQLPSVLWKIVTLLPFFGLLVLLLIAEPIKFVGSRRMLQPLTRPLAIPIGALYHKLLGVFSRQDEGAMTPEDLVLLAISHLKVKKTRSMITIGGMAIGFGSVIFLLSLGYGFQRLIVARVATLGEMKQIDVTTGQASSLTFDSAIIDSFLGIESVETVLPVIATVSKVNFNNSVSDVVAYGVTTKFLEESAIKPVRGTIFSDEEYISDAASPEQVSQTSAVVGSVAGVDVELLDGAALGKELHQIRYALFPLVWKPVYERPSLDAKIIGYTKRTTGQQLAREVWGGQYEHTESSLFGTDEQGSTYMTWVSDTFPIWQKQACSPSNFDCVDRQYLLDRGSSGQRITAGFVTQQDVGIERYGVVTTTSGSQIEGGTVQSVRFSLPSNDWTTVYEYARKDTQLNDLATRSSASSTSFEGALVLGEYYYDAKQWGYAGQNRNGKKLGLWVKAQLPVWRKLDCGSECDYYLTEQNTANTQEIKTVYLRAVDVAIPGMETPPRLGGLTGGLGLAGNTAGRVLGESTTIDEESSSASTSGQATSTAASSSASVSGIDLNALGITGAVDGLGELDWAMIASQAGIVQEKQNKDVFPLPKNARKVALVNTAMLTLLGLQPSEAVGKEFSTTFILDGKLFNKENYSAESEAATYKIIGILPDDKTPAYYVPLGDIKGLGVANYSQLKIIADDTSFVSKIREAAEAKGFRTNSVVDTIESINQLFVYLRLGLLVLGLIALGVAALGMFNTLTVSLLEKTREVGLMKAMGMKSSEVQRLFIAESVIMGVSGGAVGLLFGFVTGKAVSLVLSSISIANGSGSMDIAYIPFSLTVIIVVFSFIVGVATGWYPAHRATQVSALNALRYE